MVVPAYLQDLHPVISLRDRWVVSVLLLIVGPILRIVEYGHLQRVARLIYIGVVREDLGLLTYGGKAQAPHPDSEE